MSTDTRKFTAVGELVDADPIEVLKSVGFEVGVLATTGKSNDKHTLKAVQGGSAVLDDGKVHSIESFCASWKPYREEFYSDAEEHTSRGHISYRIASQKAVVAFALGQLSLNLQWPC